MAIKQRIDRADVASAASSANSRRASWLLALCAGCFLGATAHAGDGLRFNFEPGLALPMDDQKQNFDSFAGMDMGLRLGVKSGIFEPQISFSYMRFWNDPNNPVYGDEAGFDVPSGGLGLRLHPFQTDLASLWIDGNGQAYLAQPPKAIDPDGKQRNARFSANAGAGIAFHLGENVSFGPTVRYDQVFFPKVSDLKVLSAGITLTLSFGSDRKPSQVAYYNEENEPETTISAPAESESAPDIYEDPSILAEENAAVEENFCDINGLRLEKSEDIDSVQHVMFDFDNASLRPDAQELATKIAMCLKPFLDAHPETTVTIQGHCDERGSNDYNLALGHRRAKRIHDAFTGAGIAKEQLKVVSFGEERPTGQGWDADRRSQLASSVDPKKIPKPEPMPVAAQQPSINASDAPAQETIPAQEAIVPTATEQQPANAPATEPTPVEQPVEEPTPEPTPAATTTMNEPVPEGVQVVKF